MPDPYERHGRAGAWDWDANQLSRSQARQAAAEHDQGEPVKRPPAKKDKDLCKALHWQPHKPVLVADKWTSRWKAGCGWGIPYWSRDMDYTPQWQCRHREVCAGCGKRIADWITPRRCPSYHEITKAEKIILDAQQEQAVARRARWRRATRPVIKGKQGYRKPKKKK